MENFVPVLSKGKHDSAESGACVMEMVSFLAGEKWSDLPECSNTTIAFLAQTVNDSVSDKNRHLILRDFDRLFNTRIPLGSSIQFSNALADEKLVQKINRLSHRSVHIPPSMRDEFDYKLLNCLTRVLDIFDEMFGRETVEKQDINKLKDIAGATH